MRTFILVLLFSLLISLSSNSNAYSLEYSVDFSSEESSKKISSSSVPNISTEPKKQETQTKKEIRKEKREQKQLAKTERKEFRKAVCTTIKEQRKINKENKKNGIKEKRQKTHWAAYLSFFSALAGIGLIATAIILETVSVLFPLLIVGFLLLSVVMAITGISAVASDDKTLYHKSRTITLALIGGIASFLTLLLIGLVVVALSAAFG